MSKKPILDLGAWAEDTFAGLCAAAGVTRNKSVQDRTGWDYLIELSATKIDGLPADLQPTGRSARIQVKSKARGKPTAKLKLSNALRFAKESSPCFVVLFLATEGTEPVRIFAKHFWEKEITNTLRRGRLAGNATDLHIQTISISFSNDDEHTHDLIGWIETTLSQIGEYYEELKGHLSRTLGQEDGGIHGSLAFEAADLEALVDHQIGLPVPAPTINVTIKQRRFGIDAPEPIVSAKPDLVQMRSHPMPCRVRVLGKSSGDLWLEAELFAPGIPDLPQPLRKLRIVAGFLEILVPGTGQGKIDFRFDPHRLLALSKLREMSTLHMLAMQGELDLQIFVDGQLIFTADVTLPTPEEPRIKALPDALGCLEVAVAGVAPGDFNLSFADVFASWDELVDFAGLVTGRNLTINCTLAAPLVQSPQSRFFAAFDYLDIRDWTILAVVARPILELKTNETSLMIVCGEPRVVEARVRRGSGVDATPELLTMYRRATRDAQEGLELFGGSYRAMTTHFAGPSE